MEMNELKNLVIEMEAASRNSELEKALHHFVVVKRDVSFREMMNGWNSTEKTREETHKKIQSQINDAFSKVMQCLSVANTKSNIKFIYNIADAIINTHSYVEDMSICDSIVVAARRQLMLKKIC